MARAFSVSVEVSDSGDMKFHVDVADGDDVRFYDVVHHLRQVLTDCESRGALRVSTRTEFAEARDNAVAQRDWAEGVLADWEPTLDGVSNYGTHYTRTFVKSGYLEHVEAPCDINGGGTLATAAVLAEWVPTATAEA